MTSLLSGMFPEGISVIVCVHNGADRIGPTLRHLARQEAGSMPWEVIVVDNGSTDGTARAAREAWPTDAPAPLRLFSQPIPGYNHAADCGIAEARFNVIAHVHDDNWLEKDWLARAAAVFQSDPEIGACGGQTKASFECDPPWWFREFQENYAVGLQSEHSGDITWSRGYLWGAGLCVRRTAWMELKRQGFRPLSTGRNAGRRLISGEDSEVCFALRLAGWKLWYSEDLCLTHYLPAARLNWIYLRRLFRSFGEASAGHDCYLSVISNAGVNFERMWRDALMESLCKILRRRPRRWAALLLGSEGNPDVLRLEWQIGRIIGLMRMRGTYADAHRAVFDAEWRNAGIGAPTN